MTDTRIRLKRASGATLGRLKGSFEGLDGHIMFGVKMFAGIPMAIARYRKHILTEVGNISFGKASLLSGGGTIGVVGGMAIVAAVMVSIEIHRALGLLGFTALSGLAGSIANTQAIAPLIASLAIAAKVGTGFTAQLGSMRVSDEIDALDTLGVPSITFLATVRMLAMLIVIAPVYMVGLLGAYLASRFVIVGMLGESSGTYDYYFRQSITPEYFAYSILMTVIFAIIIAVICCSYGYNAGGGPEGVGRAAGTAVRTTILTIALAAMVLVFGLYGLTPTIPGMGLE
ncbi:ABC transporter permease [Hoyosella rhizosphaerae]|uniref:ABC transporter permease n=1 Tax=Hoyosella rhizosphaerae TaxID=1755582 RepID=A0A916XKI0_9ACTN|nr:ABC transporter permease [Hoyosella rhizosphaerae]MBN4925479.1 ABC transporter permease [Hoyosella rhizosphaerae]GGC77352.1 ABC transporter permease [Hoyosella rhizosphaerae]